MSAPERLWLAPLSCSQHQPGAHQLWGMAVHSPSPHGIQFALHRLGVSGERQRPAPGGGWGEGQHWGYTGGCP